MSCEAAKNCLKKKDANKTTTEVVHLKCPSFLCRFLAQTWCKFSYFTNSKLTLGVKFIFIISLMHTFLDKVRFLQGKLKPYDQKMDGPRQAPFGTGYTECCVIRKSCEPTLYQFMQFCPVLEMFTIANIIAFKKQQQFLK